MTSSVPHPSASKLGDLLARLPLNSPDQWSDIEITAQTLANDLRERNVAQQTALGRTLLPTTLTSLLKGATLNAPAADSARTLAIYEILRVGANLCRDHDENRSGLLEAGFPQAVVSLLENFVEIIPQNSNDPLPLSVPSLNVVKTAIGALLNASVGYEPVKDRLISLEVALTVLKLATAIYPTGLWLRAEHAPIIGETQDEELLKVWNIRTTTSTWAWKFVSELRGDDDEDNNNAARPVLGSDALPLFTSTLKCFIPPYPSPPPLFATSPARRSLVQTDFEALEEVCGLLESLCLDVEDVRLALARGITFPEGEQSCLVDMLMFVDKGDYPSYWSSESSAERVAKEKAFNSCKAAVIKAIVEVAGEPKNTDMLWDDSEPGVPGGEFVSTMVKWIRNEKGAKELKRSDLVYCATLSLGNLVRKDAHSTAIVDEPIALMPDLAALLVPEAEIQIKHGTIGLLKHLAQSQSNHAKMGEAGILQRLVACRIWDEPGDMAEIVQVSAIGVAKHLCNGDVENTFRLILSADETQMQPGLEPILALVRRSDSITVKSEGTRVVVNAIKSLWGSDVSATDEVRAQRRRDAMAVLLRPQITAVLAQLIGRSKKYPILINEGVVALLLLSTHASGGTIVLDALLNPLPAEVVRAARSPTTASDDSMGVTPRRALDMVASALRNTDERHMPVEVRANVCALLGQLGRKGVVGADRAADVEALRAATRELLEAAALETEGPKALGGSAKRALEAWGS